MERCYIFCDCQCIGSTATKEAAIKRIQKLRDYPKLSESTFSVLIGEEEVISSPKGDLKCWKC